MVKAEDKLAEDRLNEPVEPTPHVENPRRRVPMWARVAAGVAAVAAVAGGVAASVGGSGEKSGSGQPAVEAGPQTPPEAGNEAGEAKTGVVLPTTDLTPQEIATAREDMATRAWNSNKEKFVDAYFYDTSSRDALEFSDLIYKTYVRRGQVGDVGFASRGVTVLPESIVMTDNRLEYTVVKIRSVLDYYPERNGYYETVKQVTDHEVLVPKEFDGEQVFTEQSRETLDSVILSENRVADPNQ